MLLRSSNLRTVRVVDGGLLHDFTLIGTHSRYECFPLNRAKCSILAPQNIMSQVELGSGDCGEFRPAGFV